MSHFLKIKQKSPQTKFLIEISVIIFLIVTNFMLGSYFRENLLNVAWIKDDVIHIGVANNFRETGDFAVPFTQYPPAWRDATYNQIITIHPESITIPHSGKCPIYYILLGSFYELLDTSAKELYLHASLFSNLLSSIFLILFFILIKKKTNLEIAIFSSVLIILISPLTWMNARVLPLILLYIFSITSLFFLDRKKTHYLIFGVLTGLGQLTHPFGLFMGVSYSLFLILNREFKGFLIVLVAWHAILIPWFLRNYYFFGDISHGLGIPFGKIISNFLTFLPQKDFSGFSGNDLILPSLVKGISETLNPIQVFNSSFSAAWSLYHIDFLLLFLIILVPFAFMSIKEPKKNLKYKIITIGGIISFFILIINVDETILQILTLFIIIPSLLVLLNKKFKIIDDGIPRFYIFILLLLYVSLVGIFFYANLTQDPILEGTRMILFAVLLLVPISIQGFFKVTHKTLSNLTNSTKKKISFVILILVLSPIVFQLAEGIESTANYDAWWYQSDQIKEINDWIRKNVPPDSKLSSNQPFITYLGTGIKTVKLPAFENFKELEQFQQYFGIDYFIVYDLTSIKRGDQTFPTLSKMIVDVKITLFTGGSMERIYQIEGSYIGTPSFKLHNLRENLIVMHTNNVDEKSIVKKLLYEYRFNTDETQLKELKNKAANLELNGLDRGAMLVYTNIINLEPLDFGSMEAKTRLLIKLDDESGTKKAFKYLDSSYLIYIEFLRSESFNKSADYLEPLHQQFIQSWLLYLKSIDDKSALANLYEKIMKQDRFNLEAILGAADAYAKKGDNAVALHYYELALGLSENKSEILDKINELKTK